MTPEQITASYDRIAEEPREEDYGTVVVFLDLYGNRWDLIGPPAAGSTTHGG